MKWNRTAHQLAGLLSVVATLTVAGGNRVSAHPLSTTSVTIEMQPPRTVQVTLVMDADALITRLELAEHAFEPATVPPLEADRQARLLQLSPTITRHLHLTTAGQPSALVLGSVAVDDNDDATIRLRAVAPRVGAITWHTSLTDGTYVLVVRPGHGRETLQWITGSVTSDPVSMASVDPVRTAIAGVGLGFTHILPKGLDHILFVAGLALFSRGRRDLIALVTTFTAAHSVTLAMGLYGLVSVPPSVVEPLIALSVAYVGAENLFASSHARGRRLLSVLVFGLLHGLGFAGVLTDLAPSQASLLTALASFNAGVELGQLAVLVATVAVLRLASRLRLHGDRTLARYGSAAVGAIGVVWTVERLFG